MPVAVVEVVVDVPLAVLAEPSVVVVLSSVVVVEEVELDVVEDVVVVVDAALVSCAFVRSNNV